MPAPEVEETQPPPHNEAPEPFTAIAQLEADAEHEDGSTASQRMELGELIAARDFEPSEGFHGLQTACEVDRQRDAFIPGKLAVKNTTKRFPIEITSGIFVGISELSYREERYPNLPLVDVAQGFSDGPSCESPGVVAGVTFTIKPGDTGDQNFLVVVHDYYLPSFPSGRQNDLLDLRAGIYEPIPLGNEWERTCISASVPLDGETILVDGSRANDQQYEPSGLPSC